MPLDDWIDASETSSCFYGDKLLVWLDRYGSSKGVARDDERPGYDPDLDMRVFLKEKASLFHSAITNYLREREFRLIDLSQYDDFEITRSALVENYDVIARAPLRDQKRRVTARPSFLVRRDAIHRLFSAPPDISSQNADYFVVEPRMGRLHLGAKGGVMLSDSVRATQARMAMANDALAELTQRKGKVGFLIGRGWTQSIDKVDCRGSGCLDKAGVVRLDEQKLADAIGDALGWIRRVRREGSTWTLFPQPSLPELRPNTASRYDFPWHKAKTEIAERLKDPILLWHVGSVNRDLALSRGITTYDHPKASAEAFGVGEDYRAKLDAIIQMARTSDADIAPLHIVSDRDVWGESKGIEFYVDFETVTDTDDDFSGFPDAGGQALIFMVGCGHLEHGVWKFANFVATTLTPEGERQMIDEWLAHMEDTRLRLAPHVDRPICYHWSAAEEGSFAKQYSSARSRHPEATWPAPNWFDFLTRVFRKEPILVPGALGFGLKTIARAMHARGCIDVVWDEGPGDGLGAMVGAWRAYARCKGKPVQSDPAMRGIIKYNAIDCQTMQQIIAWLRRNR